jgi:hypothetical protein
VPNANAEFRYENDVVTYKANDKFSFTTELNYIHDDAFEADGYGAAQYASYALNDHLTLNGGIEVWRDDKGFFVAGFPGNHSFVYSELGLSHNDDRGRADHIQRIHRRRHIQAWASKPDPDIDASPRVTIRSVIDRHDTVQ